MSDIYKVALFEEEGFQRKKCSQCGRMFWTLDLDRETCGDTPCDEYTFMGDPPIKREYTPVEMGEEFLNFFESRGHSRVSRYPVVARWRDDIFLTIASIANFQPWVTSGEVPPPANPLVVNQPSIRLNDIDNVGRSGRHFTLFFMGGHHAFNTKKKHIYWADETVAFCQDFLTGTLGIDPSEITYIEDFWEGGGNSGEDFEVNVDGLELATLVFMHYQVENGKRRELPLKIVDTGYGIERFVWASQGTPSSYDAVFGSMITTLCERAGVHPPPEDILCEHSRLSGLMDVESGRDLAMLRSKVAEKTGMNVEEIDELMSPLESVYAIADHLRCLAFMFGDGITPSNAGEGYLARLVLRRTLRMMDDLNLQEPLVELMELELRQLAPNFPRLDERKSYILEVVDIEERRYQRTLERGKKHVDRLISSLKRKDKSKLPKEELINLYDTKGLPPEVVKRVAEEKGVKVEVPEDFYIQVAELHSQPELEEERGLKIPKAKLKDLPSTETLFYSNPYQQKFEAKVLRRVGEYVVLDRTVFFPKGGGQPCDRGILRAKSGDYEVLDVRKVDGIVVHKIGSSNLKANQRVKGEIDWKRRNSLMCHHTATHILLGAARKVLGNHVWQHGVQKGTERSRLDISHFKRVSEEELWEIERLANRIVLENRKVDASWMDRNEAEKKFGYALYQGGVVPGKEIRVVNVEGWNAQACAGTHCVRTGEVGLIKIMTRERVQDGVERLEFASGEALLTALQEQDRRINEAADILRTDPESIATAAQQLFERWKSAKKKVESLRNRLASLQTAKLQGGEEKVGDLLVIHKIIESADVDELISIGEKIVEENKSIVVLLGTRNGSASFVAMAGDKALDLGIDCEEIASKAAKALGGGGGGRPEIGQGGGPDVDKLEEAIEIGFNLCKAQQKR
ncbi:hypothetical protein AKJ45_01565 [candidate division MSBL1 archaeon SCGC-AAA261F19]|uniref:Alanine--tRNA ligase n=2 Tax=candidate division MSBL1 TaxID=215777 RepID=A0A133VAM4_9EURY|nr:hypothetical protein AKJ43_02155 [candidate division MSBL1 archaeon SCGC-AAA261D19]KXB03455.1 hypothetical protein AKJ45_01565 [candidate division MSBL1 archaeon SCGC-AAA261F19]